MNKQKLLNKPFKSPYLNPFRVRYFACLFLFLGVSLPTFAQDLNPCSSIQVIGTSENGDPNNGGAVFQGILVSNEVTPNQAIKIYNENWEQINECTSSECGNPYTFATDAGKYFVQVQLFNDDATWLCQADPFEVIVSENSSDPCAIFCQQEVVEFKSQADVDAFCGCEVITGDVRITGDVTSLAPLDGLKEIGGFLAIFSAELLDFKGLESLTSIGTDIYLGNNPLLKSLEGLGNIPQLGGSFVVESNPVLETMNGINLKSVKVLTISGNDALIDLTAFKDIQKLRGLSITANKSLQNLEGLNQLTTLGEGPTMGGGSFSLVIGGNAALQNVDALANLQATTEGILLEANSALTNCCGIAHLIDADPNNGQSVGDPQINNNAVGCNSVEEILAHCTDVTPSCDNITLSGEGGKITIGNLNAPIEIVKIYDENWNRVFECNNDCADPTVFETAAGKYYVQVQLYTENWEWICMTDNLAVTVTDGGNNCGTICEQEKIILSTQAEVDAFCGCESVTGNLIIGNYVSTDMNDITSLAALKELKEVGKDLLIFRTQLTDLQGLENLTLVKGALVMEDNSGLNDLTGLDGLHSIDGLFISNHANLIAVDGISLTNLGFVSITNNPSLGDLSAINNFTHLDALAIFGPHAATVLDDLSNLTSIGSDDGANSIVISGIGDLLNLDGLSNLTQVNGNFNLSQNEALADCCGISHLLDDNLDNGQITGTIAINNNREGCNSAAEILENCTNPTPTCDDIIVTISDLIIENDQARRNVSVTFNTPNLQRTGVTLLRRSNNEVLLDCSICEENQNLTLDVGEYVLLTDRSYLDLSNGNLGCGDIFIIDVPATPCADNDGDYICDYNECNDNDPEVMDMRKPAGTPCDDGDDATSDDVIQADGCTCAGTPISDNPCENISLSIDEENPYLIRINGRNSPIQLITIYDAEWNKLYDGTCDRQDPYSICDEFKNYPPGLYRVYVRMYDEHWQYLCETDFLEITLPDPENGSRESGNFINEKEINLFPNPVHHTLNLRTNALKGKKGTIQVFNTFGQQVAFIPQKEFSGTYETIDITGYQNGLYFMVIKLDNQRAINKPFLIEKLE